LEIQVYSYLARQPILDSDKKLFGYELLFRNGETNCYPDVAPDEATSKLLAESHLNVGVEEITQGSKAFINFFEETILYRFPTSLDPKLAVIELLEHIPLSDGVLEACKKLKSMGYTIALDDHDFDPKWQAFLPYTDIVKVDLVDTPMEGLADKLQPFKDAGIKLVAEKVETQEEFEQCKALGFDYFQGYFFALPEMIKHKQLAANKLNLIELIGESSSVEMDFHNISNIIQRDVTLSYKLLRYINSPIVNKRVEISSLEHAVRFMGELEVKKFVSLLALANLTDNAPKELITTSVVRAKFIEQISVARNDVSNPPKGFLTGLLSLIDAILNQEKAQILSRIPVLEEIKTAILEKRGDLGRYLLLVEQIERANWVEMEKSIEALNVTAELVQASYQEALMWADSICRF
jgi:EAL and modified HD-GYP domain-containing signal transduction protein